MCGPVSLYHLQAGKQRTYAGETGRGAAGASSWGEKSGGSHGVTLSFQREGLEVSAGHRYHQQQNGLEKNSFSRGIGWGLGSAAGIAHSRPQERRAASFRDSAPAIRLAALRGRDGAGTAAVCWTQLACGISS